MHAQSMQARCQRFSNETDAKNAGSLALQHARAKAIPLMSVVRPDGTGIIAREGEHVQDCHF